MTLNGGLPGGCCLALKQARASRHRRWRVLKRHHDHSTVLQAQQCYTAGGDMTRAQSSQQHSSCVYEKVLLLYTFGLLDGKWWQPQTLANACAP
eukprot:1160278-Pelagomonas_calceolata.AAC.5